MPFSDILKQLGLIGAQGGQALGNAMEAQGSPAAFQAQQQQSLQHQQLLQQLQLHNTMTPFEQGNLDVRNQEYQNQLQWHEDQVKAQTQAKRDQEHQWVLSNVGEGNIEPTTQDDPTGQAVGGGFYRPKKRPQIRIPDELKDYFPKGQETIDLTKENEPFMEKLVGIVETSRAKKANTGIIDQEVAQLHKDIDAHFDQYPGTDREQLRQSFHTQAVLAQHKDAINGNTSQLTKVEEDLRKPSYWETLNDKQKEKDKATSDRAAQNADTRSDKSYQFNKGELDKLEKPVADLAEKYYGLEDLVNQKTAQADSLVAPKLLSVLVGGTGSGLRMTQAEISNVLGGRDKYQQLLAAVQHWTPGNGLQITDVQRGQIQQLLKRVGDKVTAKQQALRDARQTLVSSDDVGVHRKAISDAQDALQKIDAEGGPMSLQQILKQKQ